MARNSRSTTRRGINEVSISRTYAVEQENYLEQSGLISSIGSHQPVQGMQCLALEPCSLSRRMLRREREPLIRSNEGARRLFFGVDERASSQSKLHMIAGMGIEE